MHRRRPLIENLHPINADVARAGLGIARVHVWQSDEAPTVFRPAFENGKIAQRKIRTAVVNLVDDFLTDCVAHLFWPRVQKMNPLFQ